MELSSHSIFVAGAKPAPVKPCKITVSTGTSFSRTGSTCTSTACFLNCSARSCVTALRDFPAPLTPPATLLKEFKASVPFLPQRDCKKFSDSLSLYQLLSRPFNIWIADSCDDSSYGTMLTIILSASPSPVPRKMLPLGVKPTATAPSPRREERKGSSCAWWHPKANRKEFRQTHQLRLGVYPP